MSVFLHLIFPDKTPEVRSGNSAEKSVEIDPFSTKNPYFMIRYHPHPDFLLVGGGTGENLFSIVLLSLTSQLLQGDF